MLFAIRLLTLMAFTVHAVLGCRLTHGSCTHEQTEILTGHSCDHADHSTDAHDFGEIDEPSLSDEHSETQQSLVCAATSSFTQPIEGHSHSNHCDNTRCIFDVSTSASNAAAKQFLADACWLKLSVELWAKPCLHGGFVWIWHAGGLPKLPRNRAVHQVWLI
jgi:hypothetical protein